MSFDRKMNCEIDRRRNSIQERHIPISVGKRGGDSQKYRPGKECMQTEMCHIFPIGVQNAD